MQITSYTTSHKGTTPMKKEKNNRGIQVKDLSQLRKIR
jgi:hypothetical protein